MEEHRKKDVAVGWIKSLLWAIGIALFVRAFFVGNFKIPSTSMVPTLKVGDRLLANKIVYRIRKPGRGEVIIFRYPEDPKRDFVKRVISSSGERILIKDGNIYINGKPVQNPLINSRYYYSDGYYGSGKETEIPPGSYYVLGDNSFNSKDSRYWGFVPEKYLVGKAMFIYWPPWRMGMIK